MRDVCTFVIICGNSAVLEVYCRAYYELIELNTKVKC
jgi:hypothetical protein